MLEPGEAAEVRVELEPPARTGLLTARVRVEAGTRSAVLPIEVRSEARQVGLAEPSLARLHHVFFVNLGPGDAARREAWFAQLEGYFDRLSIRGVRSSVAVIDTRVDSAGAALEIGGGGLGPELGVWGQAPWVYSARDGSELAARVRGEASTSEPTSLSGAIVGFASRLVQSDAAAFGALAPNTRFFLVSAGEEADRATELEVEDALRRMLGVLRAAWRVELTPEAWRTGAPQAHLFSGGAAGCSDAFGSVDPSPRLEAIWPDTVARHAICQGVLHGQEVSRFELPGSGLYVPSRSIPLPWFMPLEEFPIGSNGSPRVVVNERSMAPDSASTPWELESELRRLVFADGPGPWYADRIEVFADPNCP